MRAAPLRLPTAYCLVRSADRLLVEPLRGRLLLGGGRGGGLPEFDGGVVAGGQEEQAARGELDLVDLLLVRLELGEEAAGARVVDADDAAAARLGEHAAVGRELDLVDHLGLAQLAHLAPRARVPDDQLVVAPAARERR